MYNICMNTSGRHTSASEPSRWFWLSIVYAGLGLGVACSLMTCSAAVLWLSGAPMPLLVALCVVFTGTAAFILTRPSRTE